MTKVGALKSPNSVRRGPIAALAGTGFIARRAAAGDFDAAQHASHALEAVLPHFAPGAADAAGAALLAGDWAEALALALQHLQMHRPADDADRVLLEHPNQAAFTFYVLADGMDAQLVAPLDGGSGRQYALVGPADGQTLASVLKHNGLATADSVRFKLMKDWKRLELWGPR